MLALALRDEAAIDRTSTWALERPNGSVIGVGGLTPIWAVPWGYRSYAWAFLGDPSPAELLLATRHVRAELRERPGRVELDVAEEFEQGHRWARLLGFRPEGRADHFRPDGGAVIRYARIRPC